MSDDIGDDYIFGRRCVICGREFLGRRDGSYEHGRPMVCRPCSRDRGYDWWEKYGPSGVGARVAEVDTKEE